MSHAGTALIAQVADKLGLTQALSLRLSVLKQRRRGHDRGQVIRDLAVMLADGGECISDLGAVRDQEALFGPVASDWTALRVIDRVASEQLLEELRAAHARARERFWELQGAPESLTIDIDATLITAHSDKERAAGNYKGGYGFHPLHAYADETREALAAVLRPGNAGANTAEDHVKVLDLAPAQIPERYIEALEILVRADRAGMTHELAHYCREGRMRFSLGYDLTDSVRAAILQLPEDAWVPALDQDGSERENGEVCEITDQVDLSAWPEDSRLIVRRERPHPGAQLSFTDHDGYRFQAILTDQPDTDIAVIERRHRQRARVEDRIRDDKHTGLSKFPFKEFALNEAWLEIVLLAHDLIIWTQALLLDGALAKAEPKRLRYRLFQSPAAWRSPDVARSCTSNTPGPGPASSPPRSSASKRCLPPPADHSAGPATTSRALGPHRPQSRSPNRGRIAPTFPRKRPRHPSFPSRRCPHLTPRPPTQPAVTFARLLHDPSWPPPRQQACDPERRPMTTETPYKTLLREAARDLVDTLGPYRVLTRQSLVDLSEERYWGAVRFEEALKWAVDHGLLRQLGPDLYEVPLQRER
jgi:hypothetical protein